MSGTGPRLAAAAERLVGVPFRLHGRDPARGLDCVGVVEAALRACGRDVTFPSAYALRNRDGSDFEGQAALSGLSPTDGPSRPGDVLLVRPGPAQHHLLVAGFDGSLIHAHASLKRVVATPGPSPWPILRLWRFTEEND